MSTTDLDSPEMPRSIHTLREPSNTGVKTAAYPSAPVEGVEVGNQLVVGQASPKHGFKNENVIAVAINADVVP